MKIYINQIRGPFKANEELISQISYDKETGYMGVPKKIGIIAPPYHQVMINDRPFSISQLNVLEFDDIQLNSLYFLQDEDLNTIIDFMIPHYTIQN